jgi:hypothetical protein
MISRMMRQLPLLLSVVAAAGGTKLLAAEPVDFSSQIRPLLSDRCFHCHGPDEATREAELRLDVRPDVEHAKLVVAGKPGDSDLFRRITSSDPDERMPPDGSGKPLSADEIKVVAEWIRQGANWTTHWAYEQPVRHETPDVAVKQAGSDADWLGAGNWIDSFLAVRLNKAGLSLAEPADRVTLLRRVAFDLTGLPPEPEVVAAFLADKSPDAWSNIVDRLLDSDSFGERMAVYWLDLVRYADTVGYHGDQDHAISPYRDWVIDAFALNMPFDQFTREQLAGDLLPEASVDQQIATGYNRLLQTSHEGGVQKKEYLAMYAADRVRNLSAVWFGGTIGCAQCHDHKYDPYTSHDFYSLAAFFADVDEAEHLARGDNALPTRRAPEMIVQTRRERERIAEIDARIADLEAELKDASAESLVASIDELKTQREKLAAGRRLMITRSIEPREMRLLPRGDWLNETGPIVLPAIPAFLGQIKTADNQRASRLELANWLIDAKHGGGLLTARVMTNRFWYLMFGEGLARSLEDFGGQGETPSQPELLDRLAWEFVESNWDVKHMLRLIASSRAYRQSSIVTEQQRSLDMDNRLFGRQSRFRLPAEMVRDNALAVSGLLVRDVGGPSVKPYQPEGYYRHLNFPTRKYVADTNTGQWRRGLYVHWQRQFLHPMLKAFDAPRREECTAQRTRSNTPLASLTLLNDPTFVEAARALAQHVLATVPSVEDADRQRLDVAFRRAVSRSPDASERAVLLTLLSANRTRFNTDVEAASSLTSVGLSSNEPTENVAEFAAWTLVARAILNLSETNTRN